MSEIIECVPNFSEGRDPNKIRQITEAINSVNGVKVLHVDSDFDHNRTVITFVGSLKPVQEAAFRMIKTAANLIDLRFHNGIHPRMGATDVCPFVDIKGISSEELVVETNKLAKKIGEELEVPIFLYEKSARTDFRKNLANIRRGGYEAIKNKIGSEGWVPDFGPLKIGGPGATVMGVRNFLVAYNINLESSDLELAKTIARTIRESSGGMKSVKALGLYLEHEKCAQVSMNLVNFRETGIAEVYTEVERLALLSGVTIRESELIGLLPNAAVEVSNFGERFKFRNFSKEKILENLI